MQAMTNDPAIRDRIFGQILIGNSCGSSTLRRSEAGEPSSLAAPAHLNPGGCAAPPTLTAFDWKRRLLKTKHIARFSQAHGWLNSFATSIPTRTPPPPSHPPQPPL